MSVGGAGSNTIRFTGMATGLDTESIIKQMMKAEQMKIDKEDEKRQVFQWKQQAYRDIISDINKFKDKYFNTLSDDSILKRSNLSGFRVTNNNESFMSVKGYPGVETGKYEIDVKRMAEQGKVSGRANEITPLDLTKWGAGDEIDIKVGTETKTITLTGGYGDVDALISDINTKLEGQGIKDKVEVVNGATGIKFKAKTNEAVKITRVGDLGTSGLASELNGFTGKVLNIKSSTKLNDIMETGSTSISLQLKVDGGAEIINVELDNTDGDKTFIDLKNAVNSATDGKVSLKVSELTGKVTFVREEYGVGKSLELVSGTDEMFNGLGLGGTPPATLNAEGVNSLIEIKTPDGDVGTVERSSNEVLIDGISITARDIGKSEVTIEADVEEAFDKFAKFFDEYNTMIEKIYTKIEEKTNNSYKPLTKEQKASMDQEEIDKWEKKAKEGILRNDEILRNMLNDMRGAFFGGVDGSGAAFGEYSLGVDTSKDTTQRGKIIIKNEALFKKNLAQNAEGIINLFIKNSEVDYTRTMSGDERKKRYEESGIFRRIEDIIKDNLSTSRDGNSRKGLLLERAGILNDTSFVNNQLSKQIKERDKVIKEMTKKMYRKENSLYQRFAKLERAMNNLNSQSSWLASQLGGA